MLMKAQSDQYGARAMKASEVIEQLENMIAEEGDLELMCDCESSLRELESIELLDGPDFEPPVIVIMLT
jgi:hypothetical protein